MGANVIILNTNERDNMKKIFITILVFMSTGILNAFEYHFPNNEVNSSSTNNLLEISFTVKNSGFGNIINLLESFSELPTEYTQFLQTIKSLEGHSSHVFSAHINTFFEGEQAFLDRDMRLNITESKFKKALRKLEIGKEKDFYRIKFTLRSFHLPNYPRIIQIDNPIAEPAVLIMRCKRTDKSNATCWFIDEKEQEIKEVIANWKVSYPSNLKQQIKQEMQKNKQQKIEKDRKWDRQYEAMQKECPGLYRTLNLAQQGIYVDPVIGLKARKRFQELDCDIYLQNRLNQAMY